jgi:branched-chain amino acid transport system substrate-binding protein
MGRKPGDSPLGTRRCWWSLWLLAAALAALAILAVSCGGGEKKKAMPTAPLKIGALMAFTGDLGQYGPGIFNGAQLAVKEINAAGGVMGEPVELVQADTGTVDSQGVSEATRLVEVEGVDAIIGALSSGVTIAVANSVTVPDNVLMISPASTSPAVSTVKDEDLLFRTTVSDEVQGVALAAMVKDLGITSICTMYINNDYGQGLSQVFTENFEAMGGTVTAEVPHESEQATYASELAQCTQGKPDALAALAYPESSGLFLREAVEGKLVQHYIFCDGTKAPEMFEKLGWDVFDGSYGTAPASAETTVGPAFEAAYEAEYGKKVELPYQGQAYDTAYVIALAAQKSLKDNIDFREALRDISGPPGEIVSPGTEGFTRALELIDAGTDINYEGVSGPIDFDNNGDVFGMIEVWKVDGAAKKLVTDHVVQVDLATKEVTEVTP